MLFWGGIILVIIVVAASLILNPGKTIKQIPASKAIAYFGVAVITYLGLYEKFDTEESLATAIVISAIFEIITNTQEYLKSRKEKKQEKVKKEIKVKGMNKKKWVSIGTVIIIFIPMCVYLLTTIPLLPAGGNNDWAGFWGGYIGAIIGGIITLLVLYYTLKDEKENLAKTLEFEKNKIEEEDKKRFNNELLNCLVEYHVLMNGLYGDFKDMHGSEAYDSKIYKSTVLSKLIKIKLKSKMEDESYFYIAELLKSLEAVIESFNKWIDMKSGDIFGGKESEINTQGEVVHKNIKKFEYDIEKYYISND